jgi:asparagine synthase (glutamine-hydrolysing)
MCGITGIYGLGDGQSHKLACEAVVHMNQALAHRGPDASGIWKEDSELVLGHQRLSIIDTREVSNQPFLHEKTGDALVFNGEVYNYRELRAELESSFTFQTDSDTEVVLAALQKWGPSALHRFNGMFAMAWWNADKRELYLMRDRLGIKPLYYAESSGAFLFASEIRSLLASKRIKREHDPVGLVDYLRYQTVHAPRTIIKDVQLLNPGHWIRLQGEEVQIEKWWDAAHEVSKLPPVSSRKERTERIGNRFKEAVRLRMRADVPLGAFLSGGIDSSAIVALMQEISERPISTFSITFNEERFDESQFSRRVAEQFKTDHHEIRLTANDFLEQVPAALEAMDHPSGDGPNSFVVCAAAKKEGITVALSGLGGDELFAGYPVFTRSHDIVQQRWLASWPKGLRKLVGTLYVALKPTGQARKMADILSGDYFDLEHTYPLSRQMFLERDLRKIVPSLATHSNAVFGWLQTALEPGFPGFNLPFLSKVSLAELHTYMGHTLLRDTDQMSMANALEVRVPFLDHHLVVEALAASDEEKWPHTPKKLLTDSLDNLLPDEIIHRPKMGFTLPWDHWMRDELKLLCEEGLEALSSLESMDSKQITRIWNAFLEGDERWNFSRLWMLVALGIWMKRNGIS